MTTYTITHKCGHASALEVKERVKMRRARADWYANQPCRDCFSTAAKDAARASGQAKGVRDRAKLARMDLELPGITGTEKQVPWATDIRAAILLKAPALAGFCWHPLFQQARTWIDLRNYTNPESGACATAARVFPPAWAEAAHAARLFAWSLDGTDPRELVDEMRKVPFESVVDDYFAVAHQLKKLAGNEARRLLRAALDATLLIFAPTLPLYVVCALDTWTSGGSLDEDLSDAVVAAGLAEMEELLPEKPKGYTEAIP